MHVIPLGVDPEVFRPGLEPLALPPGPRVRFLFVGGTIFRKGIDVLLNGFRRAFPPSDGVGLVIKDMGSQSFYRGQTAEAEVAALRERGYPVEYIDRDLTEAELAGLYAACDCLVHPFRGEGFALPVVEAMACGLPVIVTRGPGARLCDETAFLIPARPGQFVECRVGELETIDRPWLSSRTWMRWLSCPRARPRGSTGERRRRRSFHPERFTWERTVEAVEQRFGCLVRECGIGHGGTRICADATEDRTSGASRFSGILESIRAAISVCRVIGVPWLRIPGKARTSLTMIVKDEQDNLPHCLSSVVGLFDEIVIVDTGSIDRTPEIAREFGARVFDFVWVDDFAAARNAALARATGDYVFWLDADDVVDPPEREKLRALLDGLPRVPTPFGVRWPAPL